MIHILASNELVITNEGQWQIEQLFFFFSYHPMSQLCINILLVEGSKHFLVLGMLSNFGVLYKSLFHIKPYIHVNFFMTYMFIKRIPLRSKQFVLPFYLSTNITFESMQVSIFPYKHLAHGNFVNHLFWNFLVVS